MEESTAILQMIYGINRVQMTPLLKSGAPVFKRDPNKLSEKNNMIKKNKSTCALHKILKGTSQYSFIVRYEEPFGKDIIYVNGLAPTFGYFHNSYKCL